MCSWWKELNQQNTTVNKWCNATKDKWKLMVSGRWETSGYKTQLKQIQDDETEEAKLQKRSQ